MGSFIRTNEPARCADTTMPERHRRFYWPLLLIAALTVPVIPAAAKRGSNPSIEDDKKTVVALDAEYQAAVKINDASTMNRILADDFILVTGSGKTYSKADMINDARAASTSYERNDEDVQTVRVWGNTAEVTATLWEKGTSSGRSFDHKFWFTDTYVRTPLGWKYVFDKYSLPLPSTVASPSLPPASEASTERDGQHDFDFEIGSWKSHISRRLHPLTGSTTWVEMEATVVIRKVWNGRANLMELESESANGHLQELNLRLYNPQSHEWSFNFASSSDGTMNRPMIGEFKNGRGEFIDQEPFNGRTILVRHVFTDITPDSHHFEQAFSDDGGKTWEPNFVATLTREKDSEQCCIHLADLAARSAFRTNSHRPYVSDESRKAGRSGTMEFPSIFVGKPNRARHALGLRFNQLSNVR
jgi:ketosteroid isomerase-like protein